MAMSKTFTITERVKAQFRFDAYNVFNHPVLALPNSCVDCGGQSGQITDIEADSAPVRRLVCGNFSSASGSLSNA